MLWIMVSYNEPVGVNHGVLLDISNNRTRTTDYDNDSIIWGGRLKIETEKISLIWFYLLNQ
jgi:hypothetical protein